MKIVEFKINKKRDELNKLIEENLSNLVIDGILEVSQELDNLISSYLFSQNHIRKQVWVSNCRLL